MEKGYFKVRFFKVRFTFPSLIGKPGSSKLRHPESPVVFSTPEIGTKLHLKMTSMCTAVSAEAKILDLIREIGRQTQEFCRISSPPLLALPEKVIQTTHSHNHCKY